MISNGELRGFWFSGSTEAFDSSLGRDMSYEWRSFRVVNGHPDSMLMDHTCSLIRWFHLCLDRTQ